MVGFCSTLILLIGTNFLKDFRSNLLSMFYIYIYIYIYMVVFCLELVTLLIYNFGESTCDDELCIEWCKIMHIFTW